MDQVTWCYDQSGTEDQGGKKHLNAVVSFNCEFCKLTIAFLWEE